MKERPNLDKMIDDIQQIINSDKNSQVRFLHVGTLMDILYLLKEKKEEDQLYPDSCNSCNRQAGCEDGTDLSTRNCGMKNL